jgi:hypothetical protein
LAAVTARLIPEVETCAVSSRAWWVRRFMMILFHAEDETANDRDEEKGL